MNEALLLMGCVILLCTLMGRYLDRLAVPSLLIFIALGMCFGENGLRCALEKTACSESPLTTMTPPT